MSPCSDWFGVLTHQINILFGNKEPWQIATITATSVLTTVWIWEQINQDESKNFIINVFICWRIEHFIS